MIDSFIDSLFEKLASFSVVPDWFWDLLAWWPYIIGFFGISVALGALYNVYRVGGWPGVVAAVGALGLIVGYIFGKRSDDKPIPPPPALPTKKKKPTVKRKTNPTLFDLDGDGIPNNKDKD